MRFSHATLILTLTFSPLTLFGQASTTAAPPAQAPSAPGSITPPPPAGPASLLQPSLTLVRSTLGSLKLDKWKKGSVRDEAASNVNAVLHDLQANMPPLVAAADAEPGSLSKAIPLMKHLDALYDVFLRIEEAARVSGPGDQVDSLQQTLKGFGTARIDYYDSLQQSAAGQEKQVLDLQATIKAQQAPPEAKPTPAPVPCTPPKPAVKKKRPAPAKTPPTAPVQPAAPKTP